MKFKTSFLVFLLFILFGIFSRTPAQISDQSPKTDTKTEDIKLAGNKIIDFADADYVFPKFSPDGSQIAFSKVLIEKTKEEPAENSEIHLYDFQKKNKAVLLSANQARKFATYASFVADLKWLNSQRLRAHISDGDVDAAVLTFNTKTRRLLKTDYEGAYDSGFYPPEMENVYLTLLKNFPEIEKEIAVTAFNVGQTIKIGSRGLVAQFAHVKSDSNIWFFDFQTKKKYLLSEVPKAVNDFRLFGGFETAGKIVFMVKDKQKTRFFTHQNDSVKQFAETDFGGSFQLKFISATKTVFLLKQPNYEEKLQSSLWLFDGQKIKLVTDVKNLTDADVSASGRIIAFCFSPDGKKRQISVRNIKGF